MDQRVIISLNVSHYFHYQQGKKQLPGVQSSNILSQVQKHKSVKQHINASVFVFFFHL